MENEKYGIELEAITSSFKNKLKELRDFTKNFGKEIKEETRFEINADISKEELFKWREDLNKSLKEAKIDLNKFKGEPTEKFYQEDVDRLNEGLIAVNNRLKEIDDSEKEVNEDLKEINQNASQSALGKLFDNSIKKIKHFTYYLLGARSVFSLFMKYQGIYYQYNEKMQYQSELSQNAIALSLAPAFEFLGNMVAYASIGIAKFIELLTGVNVLSKVSTKGIRDYNKSLKETQSLASGIDEVTNLNMPTGTGLASQYQALNDFQEKVKEVTKWFEENPWIKDLAEALKTVWNMLGDIINSIGGVQNALLILGGVKILSSLSKLIGTSGAVTLGTAGTGLLGILAITTAIAEGLSLYANKNVNNSFEEHMSKLSEYSSKFNKNMSATEYKKNLIDIDGTISDIITKIAKQPEEYKKVQKEIDPILQKLQEITGIDYIAKIQAQLEYDPKEHEGIVNGIKDGFITMFNGVKNAITGDEMSKSWEYFGKKGKDAFDDIQKEASIKFKEVGNIVKDVMKDQNMTAKLKVTADIKDVVTKLKNLANTFEASGNVFGSVGTAIKKKLASLGYEKGLDYVPYDEYPAVLHKGEAVVPAKYNPTIHSEGNDYTNSLLETLILKVDDLAKRPNEFNIDGQKFAETTYPLYESVRSRNNYIEGVVR